MEQKQVAVRDEGFSDWLRVQGYCDEDGVLAVELREARALFIQQDIQIRKADIEKNFIAIAKDLWEAYREQQWEPLGFGNFEEYLNSPEIDISKSLGYGLRQLGQFLEDGTVDEAWALRVGTSKVRALLPKLKEGKDIEEWMATAEVLSNLDLQDAVAGREIARYSGQGPLEELIKELRTKEEFWLDEVSLHVRTL